MLRPYIRLRLFQAWYIERLFNVTLSNYDVSASCGTTAQLVSLHAIQSGFTGDARRYAADDILRVARER